MFQSTNQPESSIIKCNSSRSPHAMAAMALHRWHLLPCAAAQGFGFCLGGTSLCGCHVAKTMPFSPAIELGMVNIAPIKIYKNGEDWAWFIMVLTCFNHIIHFIL
jgi:hypothetical protein